MLNNLLNEIEVLKNPEKAKILQNFFKTGKWQYGEWDIFYWLMVPISRKLVDKYYKELDFEDVKVLLKSRIHEERLIWTLCLVKKFEKWNTEEKNKVYTFYLNNRYWINNWDLVDLSAPNIVWTYLRDFCHILDKKILDELCNSSNLWDRRIGILSTFAFIRKNKFEDTIRICETLLHDKHDLINKATWWMLREVWKRDEKVLVDFLNKNIKKMNRTTLRYAIEKFNPEIRRYYLSL